MVHVRTGQMIILTYFLLFTDLFQHNMCPDEVPWLKKKKKKNIYIYIYIYYIYVKVAKNVKQCINVLRRPFEENC